MGVVEELNKEAGLKIVVTPSGSKFYVHESEVAYYNERTKKYLADNHFTNISDLQDLDRVVMAELFVWRWSMWLSQKIDYWGEPINEPDYHKAVKENSAEIRMLKKTLGLDKETRDKQRGEGSFEAFLTSLKSRAKEFGYMRNEQAAKAIELFQQLSAIITLHDNCDADEQREQHVTTNDVLSWCRDIAIPEFNKIDEEFRQTSQTYWIRKQ